MYSRDWELPRLVIKETLIMEKTVKNQKVKAPSKKELLFAIHEASGKSLKALDSLGRSNRETIEWVASLIS